MSRVSDLGGQDPERIKFEKPGDSVHGHLVRTEVVNGNFGQFVEAEMQLCDEDGQPDPKGKLVTFSCGPRDLSEWVATAEIGDEASIRLAEIIPAKKTGQAPYKRFRIVSDRETKAKQEPTTPTKWTANELDELPPDEEEVF